MREKGAMGKKRIDLGQRVEEAEVKEKSKMRRRRDTMKETLSRERWDSVESTLLTPSSRTLAMRFSRGAMDESAAESASRNLRHRNEKREILPLKPGLALCSFISYSNTTEKASNF